MTFIKNTFEFEESRIVGGDKGAEVVIVDGLGVGGMVTRKDG